MRKIEVIFSNPVDTNRVCEELDKAEIVYSARDQEIMQYGAESTSLIVKVLEIALSVGTSLLASVLYDYLKQSKGNWISPASRPSSRITSEEGVKEFLASLETENNGGSITD